MYEIRLLVTLVAFIQLASCNEGQLKFRDHARRSSQSPWGVSGSEPSKAEDSNFLTLSPFPGISAWTKGGEWLELGYISHDRALDLTGEKAVFALGQRKLPVGHPFLIYSYDSDEGALHYIADDLAEAKIVGFVDRVAIVTKTNLLVISPKNPDAPVESSLPDGAEQWSDVAALGTNSSVVLMFREGTSPGYSIYTFDILTSTWSARQSDVGLDWTAEIGGGLWTGAELIVWPRGGGWNFRRYFPESQVWGNFDLPKFRDHRDSNTVERADFQVWDGKKLVLTYSQKTEESSVPAKFAFLDPTVSGEDQWTLVDSNGSLATRASNTIVYDSAFIEFGGLVDDRLQRRLRCAYHGAEIVRGGKGEILPVHPQMLVSDEAWVGGEDAEEKGPLALTDAFIFKSETAVFVLGGCRRPLNDGGCGAGSGELWKGRIDGVDSGE